MTYATDKKGDKKLDVVIDELDNMAIKYLIREHARKQRGGRRVPARQCVRQNGIPFTSLVLESARREKITYRDVSDYLSVGLKHLPAVESLVREGKGQYG